MSVWQVVAQRAREAAHLTAAGITLLFVAPVGFYLSQQHFGSDADLGKRIALHAEIYSQRIAHTLSQAVAATTVLSDGFRQQDATQLSRTVASVLKIVGPATILEIAPDGTAPIAITRSNTALGDLSMRTLPNPAVWQHPLPVGEPMINVRGNQLVVTQTLANQSPEGRTRYWGSVSVIVPFTALAQLTQLSELSAEGLAIRVQHILNRQTPGTVLFDTLQEAAAITTSKDIRLTPDSRLQFDMAPAAGVARGTGLAAWIYLLLGSLALYAISLQLLKRPAQLAQEVWRHTQLLDNEKDALEREIAGRLEAEKMLERSHRLLDSIFEHIPGMIVLKRASDRRIARINRSGEQILGRTRQTLIGRSNDEIYDPHLAGRLNQSDEQVISSLEPLEIPLEQVTMPGQAGRWVKLRKTVLLGEAGNPEYILEFGQDVTEQEQLDLRLREHLHFLEQLVDAIPSPLYFKDTKGRYIGVNSAFEQYIGVDRSAISGKSNFDISNPPMAYAHDRADMDLLVAGGHQSYESTIANAHGDDRDVLFHKAVFHQTDGGVGGIVGILLDITERKQAEQQVAQLNRLLTLLSDANQAIVRIRQPAELLGFVAELLSQSGKFPIAWVHLADGNRLLVSEACGQQAALIHEVIASPDAGAERDALAPLYCGTDERFTRPLADKLEGHGLKAFIHLPLHQQGEPVGHIGILDTSLDTFSSNDRQLIEDLANNLSHALESMQAEALRLATAEQLQLAARVFENSAEGIIITDARNRILMVNKTFSAVTGYAPEEVIGQNPNLLSSGRQEASFYREMWQTLSTDGEWRGEIENRRKNGELYPEWLNISVARQADGTISNYVAVFSDLTNRKEIENRLVFLSHFDSLTALPNRILFHDQLRHATEQARARQTKVALLTMDLDRFKIFNDTMGHGAGDRLLVEASARLKSCMAPGDSLCRLGGDEFAIILNNIGAAGDAATMASACQRKLRTPIVIDNHEIHLSASIGISIFPDDADSFEGLISSADSAMYVAIEQGGNAFRFFQQEMNARSAERMRIEGRLHHALERGELSVFFQPLICAKSGRIAGAEALLRWHSDELGTVSPAVFIPLMEETQLIRPIGQWVLRKACEENKRWREQTGEDLFVAVNLSAVQLADEKLIENIRKILVDTRIDPRHLEIELTESAVMHDSELGIRTLNQIKELGVNLSIDDFGTGYSSLSYLKQFPLDTLKIDRSFVMDAVGDDDASAIIKAIVAMGHTLGFHIIAEGVEDIEQVALLRDVSVDILQGYYFSRPVPASQFEELLRRTPCFTLPKPGGGEPMPVNQPIPLASRRK